MNAATQAIHTDPTSQHRFIEPVDALFLRGNKLFGDPGSQGDSLVPPWPSTAAGALRSQLLAAEGIDLGAFAQGRINHPALGTPHHPGPFALTAFTLARRLANGECETLHPLPADLVVTGQDSRRHIQNMRPQALRHGLLSSGVFGQSPILPAAERHKASIGLWLTQAGWQRYLQGQLPDPQTELVKTSDLWAIDTRVGIGLNEGTRSADDGKLFATQAVIFKPGVGFAASVCGAQLPDRGSLRLGGDGRAASSEAIAMQPTQVELPALVAQGRCRIILTSPGLFARGWLPNGFAQQSDGSYQLNLQGVRARLVCASVSRSETVSGWDLASWQPKAALRAAPTGSVYWLDQLHATPDTLGKLAEGGLWSEPCEDNSRRAEGFNRFTFATYDCK